MTPSTSLSHTVNNPLGYFWVPSKTRRPQQTPLKAEKRGRRARQRRGCWWSAERKRDNGIGIRFIQRKGAAVISSPSPSWLRGRHAERSEGQAKRRQHCVGTVTHRHLFWHAQGRLLSVEHANCWPAVIRQQRSAGGKMRPPVTAERGDGQALSSLPQTPALKHRKSGPITGGKAPARDFLMASAHSQLMRLLVGMITTGFNGESPRTFTLVSWHWSRCLCVVSWSWVWSSSVHLWLPNKALRQIMCAQIIAEYIWYLMSLFLMVMLKKV